MLYASWDIPKTVKTFDNKGCSMMGWNFPGFSLLPFLQTLMVAFLFIVIGKLFWTHTICVNLQKSNLTIVQLLKAMMLIGQRDKEMLMNSCCLLLWLSLRRMECQHWSLLLTDQIFSSKIKSKIIYDCFLYLTLFWNNLYTPIHYLYFVQNNPLTHLISLS